MDFELKNPPIIEKRNLVKSGASLVISLPKKWLKENDLENGGEVIVVANGDLQLMKASEQNVEKINEKISKIRNQLSNSQVNTNPINSNDI